MVSPNLSKAIIGSAPGDRTNISGVVHNESAYDPGKSNVGGSTNCCPIFLIIYCCTAGTILSGRNKRKITSLKKKNRSKMKSFFFVKPF